MKKLFLISLGGKIKNANVEVHDVQFVLANTLEETYAILKERWFGEMRGLHIDSYMVLDHIDGYSITVADHPSESEDDLYLANIGGYKEGEMLEYHNLELVVEPSVTAVNKRMKSKYEKIYFSAHVDNIVKVSDLLDGAYIHFNKSDAPPSEITITGFHKI